MRFEEFSEDGATELNQDVLNLGQIALALGLCQDLQAHLHSLNVVFISRHSCHLAFL